MVNGGEPRAANTWVPLDVERESQPNELTPVYDFQALSHRQRNPWKRLLPFLQFLLIPLLGILVIIFFSLYVSEAGKTRSSLRWNGVGDQVYISTSGYRPFRDFDIEKDYRGVDRQQTSKHGMVVTNNGECSDLAAGILKQGGNAIDAAVTATLCVGIHTPMSSGIGGGGFILVHLENGTSKVIDAREFAPMGSSKDMYNGSGSIEASIGGKSVAVPMELKGLWLMWNEFGSLDWADLVNPVIPLAEDGFKTHPYLIQSLIYKTAPKVWMLFDGLRDAFMVKQGDVWRLPNIGETCCKRPALATTLRLLAEKGAEELYKSDWGDDLVHDIQTHTFPGNITKEELVEFQPRMQDPIRAKVFGMDIITMTPPSSGAALVAALKFLDTYDDHLDPVAPVAHRLVEAMKHMFAIRSNLGDPGSENQFMHLTELLAEVVTDEFAQTLRQSTDDEQTHSNRSHYGGIYGLDSEVVLDSGTAHLSVVDGKGNAVAITTSINHSYGSKLVSNRTGVILNDLMDDFQKPGITPPPKTTLPESRNFIEPGKKPLSSMTPTMLFEDGKLRMVIGATGGPTIITTILQIIYNVFKRNYTLRAAVNEPRLQDFLVGVTISEELHRGEYTFAVNEKILEQLKSQGHEIRIVAMPTSAEAILIDQHGVMTGVSDARKDGAPSGVP